MIVARVHGPAGWVFLIVAENEEKAYDLVEKELMNQTYYTKEDLEGEIHFDDRVYIQFNDVEINDSAIIQLY